MGSKGEIVVVRTSNDVPSLSWERKPIVCPIRGDFDNVVINPAHLFDFTREVQREGRWTLYAGRMKTGRYAPM